MNTPKPVQQRQRCFAPYLKRLRDGGSATAGPLTFDGHEIVLDSWERSVLEKGRLEPGKHPWSGLLAEGVALQAKCLCELGSLDSLAPAELETLLPQLKRIAAAGLALQEEFQRHVDASIRSGDLAQAKRLTGCRNKVVQCVSELKGRLGEAAYSEAECQAQEMLGPPPRSRKQPLQEKDPNPPRPFKRDVHYKTAVSVSVRPAGAGKIRTLLLVLAVSVVVYLAAILPRQMRSTGPPVLKAEKFEAISVVQSVSARPPSLFVKVDPPAWRQMGPEDKRRAIQQVASIADAAGYVGVHFGMPEGSTVGQWLKKRGVRLLDARSAS